MMAPPQQKTTDHKAAPSSRPSGTIHKNTHHPSINSKTNMSSLRSPTIYTPPTTFPVPRSPPSHLPIRLPLHSPQLSSLDTTYNSTAHLLLDTSKMLGKGGVGVGVSSFGEYVIEGADNLQEREEGDGGGRDVDEILLRNNYREALQILEKHVQSRLPYVECASRRLQAVMGVKNENVFDLPSIRHSTLSPSIQKLYSTPDASALSSSSSLDAGSSALAAARNGNSTNLFPSSNISTNTQSQSQGLRSPISPVFSGAQVNPKTGKGLREWLLTQGKESRSQRKLECRSISFHDFRPELRTGKHGNVLLGHYAVGEKGERVDVYEVDLQTTTTDPQTGAEIPTTEPWIWFLISRPILTLSATDTSTRPRLNPNTDSPSTPTSSSSSKYWTPSTQPSPNQNQNQNPIPTGYPTAPPNFPHPYPTSWLVFACPTAHVTSYPSVVETPSSSTNLPEPHNKPNYPFLRSANTNTARRGGKKIHKRKDFDFSHQGTPLFEFSSVDLFPSASPSTSTSTSASEQTQARSFLSVENLGRFFDGEDEWEECSDEEYKFVVERWEDGGYRLGGGRYKDEEGHEREKELPSPYKGQWWKCFYEAMYRDAARWNRVRAAMGMGMCRVVVRWVEYESDSGTNPGNGEGMGDGDAEMGGMNTGVGLGIEVRGGRLTRSESRRRSQLSVTSTNSCGTVIGIGSGSGGEDNLAVSVSKEMIDELGENARSRAAAGAVGNKDFGIGGKEKGGGKAKKI